MVKPLPPGCRLTAIFDSCHSGTALDLPYVYSTEGKIKEPNLLAEAGQGLMGAGMSYLRGDFGGMLSGIMNVGKTAMGSNSQAEQITRQTKTSPADVVMWSGCKDSQTSADTQEAGRATGAMSYAFIAALTKYPQQSYIQLLNTIRDELRGRYSQKPQLSASHPIDVNLLFIA
ncbi:Ca(2+)-dependent cysteine protease [Saitozyma podzolica]|uniref:Ca(2+)-dependent cysteine protease n=1 Tax=Saitozyma podzolica TaxID=1890683 RepID=A0A427XVJ7_9TREE|nr:Ca(2+)-dependent cysteine protease [Saitozyma podzolica]